VRSIVHDIHKLLFRTRFFVFTKFSMPNDNHMDTHIIYYLTVVHLYKCTGISKLGLRAVNMLQARATLIRHWGRQNRYGLVKPL